MELKSKMSEACDVKVSLSISSEVSALTTETDYISNRSMIISISMKTTVDAAEPFDFELSLKPDGAGPFY